MSEVATKRPTKPHMDQMTERSLRYIEGWKFRKQQNAGREVRFGGLEIGELFTLPGGKLIQEKTGENRAQAGSQSVLYQPWEQVVRVNGNGGGER